MVQTMHINGNLINNAYVAVVIVAKPDRSRHSLKFLLETNPTYKVVGQANDRRLAVELVHQHRPDLLILDTNLSPTCAWLMILQHVKANSPKTRCLILAAPDETQQASAADAVLMKGFPLVSLFATLDKLLS